MRFGLIDLSADGQDKRIETGVDVSGLDLTAESIDRLYMFGQVSVGTTPAWTVTNLTRGVRVFGALDAALTTLSALLFWRWLFRLFLSRPIHLAFGPFAQAFDVGAMPDDDHRREQGGDAATHGDLANLITHQ